ncbi:MAG: thiol-disulfide oxidoreductase DCC family protein [Planctomycetota bacterium]
MSTGPDTIVFFDGSCRLCNGWVRFVLRHERAATLRFASLDSQAATRALRESGLELDTIDSIIVLHGGQWLTHSSAAVCICGHLRWPWRALVWLGLIPKPLRDWAYRVLAKNRYRLFGRTDRCLVPGPEHAGRFL